MIDRAGRDAGRAAELRRQFDSSFAVARDTSTAAVVDLLAVRVGESRCAIRLSDVSGVFPDTTIEPVPSHCPLLLGIAAFRGSFLPVFDLRAILGQRFGGPVGWTFLVSGPTRLGLAFDGFDGHLRVPDGAIASAQPSRAAPDHTRDIVATSAGVMPVLHLPSVLTTIERQTTARSTKEQ